MAYQVVQKKSRNLDRKWGCWALCSSLHLFEPWFSRYFWNNKILEFVLNHFNLELYDVAEESFTMKIVANDPDVMDDKKIISEMIENKESPCQSSLQSPNY